MRMSVNVCRWLGHHEATGIPLLVMQVHVWPVAKRNQYKQYPNRAQCYELQFHDRIIQTWWNYTNVINQLNLHPMYGYWPHNNAKDHTVLCKSFKHWDLQRGCWRSLNTTTGSNSNHTRPFPPSSVKPAFRYTRWVLTRRNHLHVHCTSDLFGSQDFLLGS